MSGFWNLCLDKFKQKLPPVRFSTWISPLMLEGEGTSEQGLRLVAPSDFIRKWVRDNYLDFIQECAADYYGKPVRIQLEIREPKPGSKQANKQTAEKTNDAGKASESADEAVSLPSARKPGKTAAGAETSKSAAVKKGANIVYERTRLNLNQLFENLVVGKANSLACAAAEKVAEKPGSSLYNPLFIYGGPGLGKTHLMHAIGNRIIQQEPDKVVRYIHTEEYCNDLVNAYRQGTFSDMKNYYRRLDALLLDDVQFLGVGDKARTKEELFFIFNALVESGKQIIITCDTYPKNINGLDERLVSRFDCGLTVQIEPPETEMRVAILQKKAEMENLSLSSEVAFFIAKSLRANVRELEGALKKVIAYATFRKLPITLELTREALKDLISSNRATSIEYIQKTVADFYRIKMADLVSQKRARLIARPRQIAMWLCKEITSYSYPVIGEAFGGRDHSTVIHAVKNIENLRAQDNQLQHDLHVPMQCFKG